MPLRPLESLLLGVLSRGPDVRDAIQRVEPERGSQRHCADRQNPANQTLEPCQGTPVNHRLPPDELAQLRQSGIAQAGRWLRICRGIGARRRTYRLAPRVFHYRAA